uniref:Pex2 / Pex12 amino terminal region protein n=1 Tax=Toxoplasma gondii COUG TaxID=1074873 RepID=A0A2G8YCQ9_TOXGO|nr:Pex2 / Pex12 amino terminal region protein [Toxoplasma gondii COUG]
MCAISGGPRVLRVNQVDALRVDQELVLLLQEEANGILRHLFPLSPVRRQRELLLAFQLFFFCAYTLRNRPSPGDLLQNVKYRSQSQTDEAGQPGSHALSAAAARDRAFLLAPARRERSLTEGLKDFQVRQFLSKRKKLLILLFSILLPYGFEVLQSAVTERYLALLSVLQQRARRAEARRRFRPAQERRNASLSPTGNHASATGEERTAGAGAVVSHLALTREERLVVVLYRVSQLVHTLLVALQVVQAISFLVHGTHRSLTDWLLGLEMEFIAPSLPRSISLELLQHQLYWHALTQLLLLVVPNLPQHRLLLRRLLRLGTRSGGRLAALRHRLAVWLRTKEAELRRRETDASDLQSQQSAEQAEHSQSNTGHRRSQDEPKSRPSKAGKTCASKKRPSPRPKTCTPTVSLPQHQVGRSTASSNAHTFASQPTRGSADAMVFLRTIGVSCRILGYRSLRAACGGLARLTYGGADFPSLREGETRRIYLTKAELAKRDPRSGPVTCDVALPYQACAEETDSESDFTETENASCVFCGKEDILLPFRGDACRHHFCYWCVASHPSFRLVPNDRRTRGECTKNNAAQNRVPDATEADSAIELEAADGEELLECPACGAEIQSIAWAQ